LWLNVDMYVPKLPKYYHYFKLPSELKFRTMHHMQQDEQSKVKNGYSDNKKNSDALN